MSFVGQWESVKCSSGGAKREFAKLMLNGLAGKFGQARIRLHELIQAFGAGLDDFQSAAHVRLPIIRALRTPEHGVETSGNGLDRCEGIIQLVADDADEALPRFQFLLAQRLAEIGDHDKFVRQSSFAKTGPAHPPAAGATGEGARQHAGVLAGEAVNEIEFAGLPAQESFGGLAHEFLTRAIDEAQGFVRVEGEDGDIDFLHDGAQQGGGLERAEPLFLQRAAEQVDLRHHIAEGVVAIGSARPDGKIPLPQRGEQIGHGVQWTDHLLAQGECKPKPAQDHDQTERPFHLGRVITRVEQRARDDQPR